MLTGSQRTITSAAVLIALGFLGSRLLGALRAVVIANEFGASAELDAFFVAQRLPELTFQLLAGATLASAFIPVYARYISRRGEDEAWRLASIVLNFVLLATIAFAVVMLIFAEWIVPAMAPGLGEDSGLQEELRDDAIFLTRVMLVSPILFAVSGMITGILNARRHFLLPAIAPMMYNLAIIVGALALSDRFGVEALAIGVIVGSGLHLIIQLPALFASGARFLPSLNLRDPGVREVLRLMGPRMIGLAAAQINLIVLTFFASFVGDTSISALNFAWLILLFPVGMFGMALAMAMFPALAERAAEGGGREVRVMIGQALRFTLFLSVPAGVGLILLREPLVRALLEHGAFDAAASDLVADVLLFYAIALFAHTAIEILSRGFYALSDTRTPVTFAVAAMLVNIVLAAALVGPLEVQGLALALSIATMVEALGLFIVLHRRLGFELWTRKMATTVFRIVIATALMAEAVGVVLLILDDGGNFGPRSFFALLVGTVVGAVVYYAATLIMRLDEAQLVAVRIQAFLPGGPSRASPPLR
ncbi:MAG: murein biosynthesis integral membrane protein MurJ [Dehalococcoidia bacterium]